MRGARLLFAACIFFVLLPPASGRSTLTHGGQTVFRVGQLTWSLHTVGVVVDWIIGLRWTLAFLVAIPFWLTTLAASRLRSLSRETGDGYSLTMGPLPQSSATSDRVDASRDEARWRRVKTSVETTWAYERDRFAQSLKRLALNVVIFGDVATVVLTSCIVVLTLQPENLVWGDLDAGHVRYLMLSVAAATSTAFLVRFGKLTVRISSRDVSTRMFAWASRSLALVAVADIGLYFVFRAELNTGLALLLGIFAGATGDHAIQLLLDKAAGTFKTTSAPAAGPSPLLKIEGITSEHVDRLEEEGILSVSDVAFVPTARLFFATAYSLQQICEWQDRALLSVYVGPSGAESLSQHMKMLGAIDLRACAHAAVYERTHGAKAKAALGKALVIEDDGSLDEFLDSMAHDDAIMRLALHWRSAIRAGALTNANAVADEEGEFASEESLTIEVTDGSHHAYCAAERRERLTEEPTCR